MVVTCFIEFENGKCNNYLPGQTVIGKAILTAEKKEEVKAVTLEIHGCADTRWSEKELMSDETDTTFSGHIDYINLITRSFELAKDSKIANNTRPGVIIEPGVHYLPFSCQIPAHCPSSVEGSYGYIRYWIQVTLKRPWKLPETFNRCFNVVNANAVNFSRELKAPVHTELSKVFGWGFFKSEPLEISVELPQRGFTIGQSIPVRILVANNTKARIDGIFVGLVMMITYFSTSPRKTSKSETKTICELKGDSVPRNCKKKFNYLLPIPSEIPSTCSDLCRIIQIAYHLEVEAKMQGILYRNQSVATPVFIAIALEEVPMPTTSLNLTKEMQISKENDAVEKLEKHSDRACSNYNKATEENQL